MKMGGSGVRGAGWWATRQQSRLPLPREVAGPDLFVALRGGSVSWMTDAASAVRVCDSRGIRGGGTRPQQHGLHITYTCLRACLAHAHKLLPQCTRSQGQCDG
jgi:hypothetical protein